MSHFTNDPDPLGHANDGVTPESDALYAAEEALGLLLHDAPAGEFSLQREAWNKVRAALSMPVLPDPHGVKACAEPRRWHELKTDPSLFDEVASGRKTWEIRLDDRDYIVGDGLILRKTLHSGSQMRNGHALIYVGEPLRFVVTHVLTGYGLQDGWCGLSIRPYGVQECRACHGKGYTNEGDPEIGNALFDCEACSGTGRVPAEAVRPLPAMAVAAAVSSAQVSDRVDPTACPACVGAGVELEGVSAGRACATCGGTGDAPGVTVPHGETFSRPDADALGKQ